MCDAIKSINRFRLPSQPVTLCEVPTQRWTKHSLFWEILMPLRPSESASGLNFLTEPQASFSRPHRRLRTAVDQPAPSVGTCSPGSSPQALIHHTLPQHSWLTAVNLFSFPRRRGGTGGTSIFTNWASMLLSVTFTTLLSKARPQILWYWQKEIGLQKVWGECWVSVASVRRRKNRLRKSVFWKAAWLIWSRAASHRGSARRSPQNGAPSEAPTRYRVRLRGGKRSGARLSEILMPPQIRETRIITAAACWHLKANQIQFESEAS